MSIGSPLGCLSNSGCPPQQRSVLVVPWRWAFSIQTRPPWTKCCARWNSRGFWLLKAKEWTGPNYDYAMLCPCYAPLVDSAPSGRSFQCTTEELTVTCGGENWHRWQWLATRSDSGIWGHYNNIKARSAVAAARGHRWLSNVSWKSLIKLCPTLLLCLWLSSSEQFPAFPTSTRPNITSQHDWSRAVAGAHAVVCFQRSSKRRISLRLLHRQLRQLRQPRCGRPWSAAVPLVVWGGGASCSSGRWVIKLCQEEVDEELLYAKSWF